ncbi:MAG TPA: polyphosphate kinase 1 [Bryobacteraceae bacterium]|nr:polyphosphate kinase 1 [Bryobacteraceae bacterium]
MSTLVKAPVLEPAADLNDPSLYIDRELSLLAFQRRVLEEAQDPANAILERVKFLSILFSNLDEFYMVRFAVLKQKVNGSVVDGVINEQLDQIRVCVKDLMADAYATWRDLSTALAAGGIEIRDYAQLNSRERSAMEAYFRQVVYPVLTPLAFDPGRPFPHISNLSLNLAVAVRDAKGVERFARVKVPDTLPQLVPVEQGSGGRPVLIWLEQLIIENLQMLFPGLDIIEAYPFRVTRDAEVEIQELESDDLLETIEEAVWQRRFRAVVRLQVSSEIPEHIVDTLIANLEIDRRDLYPVDGPLDLGRVRQILSLDRPDLKDAPFLPYTPAELNPKREDDIFAVLRREDILLHHPYESFQPVVEFLRRAAVDPDVLAIKITLYRVGRNSPVVESLLSAIENGKQVAVLVELKARFDEESNIEWARALEAAGVHVVYGLVGLKVHSKVALVVRREGETIRRYVHLGTGNYNPTTARLYTDLSLFTADEQIGADVTDLFNYVTGYSAKAHFHKLLVAPVTMHQRLEELIRREIDHAEHGREARLIFKMNALEDAEIMRLLYRASQAGVKVDLLVRGICSLRPGIPGVSDNIRVTSIVGRFLEHSRIYYFQNAGREQVYLGSADLMGRNLHHRVELLFPVESKRLLKRLREDILETYLKDNRNARHMQPDGTFVWDKSGEPSVDSQAQFLVAPVARTEVRKKKPK